MTAWATSTARSRRATPMSPPGMRERLMLGLTQQWETALDARLALCPRSPVRVRNDLLRARAAVLR